MNVRLAGYSDVGFIAELYKILFAEMADLQPLIWRPAEMPLGSLAEMISGKCSDILVVESGGEVRGFAVVHEKDTLPFSCFAPNRFAYLMDLVVAPGYRGNGWGSKLMAAAEEWARDRGLAWLELNVLEENAGAMRLYERIGMKQAQHILRKVL